MSTEGIKPMASLGSALLGRRAPARRVPLTFAPIEELTADATIDADLPEVMLQVARLAQALGIDTPADVVDAHEQVGQGQVGQEQVGQEQVGGPARSRVAFTLRFDPARHGQLRQLAATQRRSAQQVLVEAFDRYCAGQSGTAASSATKSSPCQAPTGNQP